MTRTAAALIIGNEILTGKIQEANLAHLGRELFRLGVKLQRVVICEDDTEAIARDLTALRTAFDFVFTSGGVGPTLDDVTIRAVAQSFERPIERTPTLAQLLADHFGDKLTEAHLRMADLPAGSELVSDGDSPWPTVLVGNVFVLPGLPEIFRLKIPAIRRHLGVGKPFLSRAIYTRCDEAELVHLLEEVAAAYPQVSLGSYPLWGRDIPYDTKLTVDGQDEQAVEAAAAALRAGIPTDKIVEM